MSTNVSPVDELEEVKEEIQEQEGRDLLEGGGDGNDPMALKDWLSSSEDGSNAGDSEGEGEEVNVEKVEPLMVEDTLEMILDYLSFVKLKEIRSVHPIWRKVATRLMEPRCQPINFNGITGLVDMKRLNKLLSTSSGFPCQKFRIFIDMLHSLENLHKDPNYKPLTDHEKQEILATFFRLISPFVQQLEINCLIDDGIPLFPEGLPPADEFHFPELTTLLFDLGDKTQDSDAETRNVHTSFLINIVEHAPKLTDVHPGRQDQYVDAVVRRIPEDNLRRMQKLLLKGDISDQDLTEWLNREVRHLRELELLLKGGKQPSVSEEALARFLQVQSETLETLSIECVVTERPFILQLPQCQQLKRMYIASRATPFTDFLQIAFRDYSFPILKRLALDQHLDAFFNVNVTPMETVKELELHSSLSNPSMVAEIARVLPNLHKLILWVQPDSLGAKHLEPLNNVKELVLWCNINSTATSCDEFLTGCSVKAIEQARELAEASDRVLKILAEGEEPVAFLKGLKELTIKGEGQAGFSDVSCRFVLLKLPDLTCLDVAKCDAPLTISPQVMADMQKKFVVHVKPEKENVKDKDDDSESAVDSDAEWWRELYDAVLFVSFLGVVISFFTYHLIDGELGTFLLELYNRVVFGFASLVLEYL